MKSKRLDNAGMNGAQNNMAKRLQKVQGQLDDISKEISDMEFMGSSGGDAVQVIAKGDKTILEISIKESSKEEFLKDMDMLLDLIAAAANDALKKVDEYTDQEISKITKGIPIPGLN